MLRWAPPRLKSNGPYKITEVSLAETSLALKTLRQDCDVFRLIEFVC